MHTNTNVLIFGGTFDPIHLGHIETAITVQKAFQFKRFIFLPCKMPVLKEKPRASAEQRLAMLQLALETPEYSKFHFEIDKREVLREGPSYTITTLKEYRKELAKDAAITWMMGPDAFASLAKWHRWEELLLYCNILLIERPLQHHFSPIINELLLHHETNKKQDIINKHAGNIYRFNAGMFAISSTEIREQVEASLGELPLPEAVKKYIYRNKLYPSDGCN